MAHETLASLLVQRIRTDGANPFVTFYDLDSGERTELSAVTFGNWVDKTAGFARDELDLQIGDRVHIVLPLHWHTLVWWAACARAGLIVTDDDADVHVVGPEETKWADARASGASQIVAVSLQPWARGFTSPLPAPLIDFADQVRLFPDVFAEPIPDSRSRVVEGRNTSADHSQLIEIAQRRLADGSVAADRILVPESPVASADLVDAVAELLVTPLLASASLVLVRHPERGDLATIEAQERTTLRWSNPLMQNEFM